MRLATDKYGGATLQRCLEAGDADQRLTLAVAITKNALALVSDAHGNYILQHVLTMQALPPKQAAIAALKGSFVRLARHKFGSNVVEKCVQAGEWALAEVVSEISAARSGVEDLLSDQYGNYVVRFISVMLSRFGRSHGDLAQNRIAVADAEHYPAVRAGRHDA